MGKPLRVLIIEDSEDDARLILRELERGGYDPISKRVETPEAMDSTLKEGTWDIIISDYTLPHFSAPAALKLLQESGLDLPFIVVTGTVGEEIVVEVMKSGAHDYILKSNLKRFVVAIERELREAEIRREHKRMEVELRVAEGNFRNSIEKSPLGIRIVTVEGELLYANRAFLDIVGHSSMEELKATPISKLYIPESYAEHLERKKKKKLGKANLTQYEITIVRKDGQIRNLVVSRKPLVWNGEIQFQVIYQDITKRKQAEEALQEEQRRLKEAQALGEIGSWEYDLDNHEIAWSDETYVLYERDPALGPPTEDEEAKYYSAEQIKKLRDYAARSIKNREKFKHDMEVILPSGGKKFFTATMRPIVNQSGRVVKLFGTIQDITERKKMQQQLMLTDRLASIGQLASGIAHELNNPLTSVIGFSELLLRRENLPDNVKEHLTIVYNEARRTATIVKGLLTFARKQKTGKEPVDINNVIQNVLQLRNYEQRINNIEVVTRFATGLPEVLGDGAQLQQVCINIIINAEQAILEAHHSGKLMVATEQVGDMVRITFTDDGPGINPENMNKLFTPFFTTKETGKGTGLGLSICHGVVAEHGGRIYARSEPGEGATFVIELPISK